MPSSISSRPTYSPTQVMETLTQWAFHRIPPFALTYRVSNRSGYSRGGQPVWHGPRGRGIDRRGGLQTRRSMGYRRSRAACRECGASTMTDMRNPIALRAMMLGVCWALIAGVFSDPTAAPVLAQGRREEALFRGDETPLMKAAANGQVENIRRLLASGAPVDARNGAGMTALMLAAWAGKQEAVAVLLETGADPNATSGRGETALVQAIWSGDLPTMRTLIAKGANVNLADRDGGTALQLAAGRGNEAAARMLLDAGADISIRRGPIDYAALHYAAWTGNGATIRTLLSAGARVNDPASGGWTPLMIAILYGRTDVVEALIAGGADVNARTPTGWTALKEAQKRGHREIAKRLVRAGAIDYPDGSR